MKRYRPNVAILLVNEDDEILICERVEEDGAWQFPQGGVDKKETPTIALYREVWEEIGLEPEDYEILDRKEGYKYKYPPGVREKKKKKHNIIGQEQTYFLCKLTGSKEKVNVHQDPPEFQAYKWIKPKDFKLKWLPKFKKDVYKQVFSDFFEVDLN